MTTESDAAAARTDVTSCMTQDQIIWTMVSCRRVIELRREINKGLIARNLQEMRTNLRFTRQWTTDLSMSGATQNEKLDKPTNITQNLENKLNGIQEKMVHYENKLNQLEEKKEQLRDEMVQKTNLLVFQLDRQDQYIRRENILIYGVEENKEVNESVKHGLSETNIALPSVVKSNIF